MAEIDWSKMVDWEIEVIEEAEEETVLLADGATIRVRRSLVHDDLPKPPQFATVDEANQWLQEHYPEAFK